MSTVFELMHFSATVRADHCILEACQTESHCRTTDLPLVEQVPDFLRDSKQGIPKQSTLRHWPPKRALEQCSWSAGSPSGRAVAVAHCECKAVNMVIRPPRRAKKYTTHDKFEPWFSHDRSVDWLISKTTSAWYKAGKNLVFDRHASNVRKDTLSKPTGDSVYRAEMRYSKSQRSSIAPSHNEKITKIWQDWKCWSLPTCLTFGHSVHLLTESTEGALGFAGGMTLQNFVRSMLAASSGLAHGAKVLLRHPGLDFISATLLGCFHALHLPIPTLSFGSSYKRTPWLIGKGFNLLGSPRPATSKGKG